MKTPYLDDKINGYEFLKRKGCLTELGQKCLDEFKAIKKALAVDQIEQFICYKEELGNSRCSSKCVECGKNES